MTIERSQGGQGGTDAAPIAKQVMESLLSDDAGDVTTGTIVDGRYEVKARLGSGGMADVYRAQDLQLGREVALKLLYRRFAEDRVFVERFRREASAAAGLQHPNVVSVYDRGEWDGTSYIAMELPRRAARCKRARPGGRAAGPGPRDRLHDRSSCAPRASRTAAGSCTATSSRTTCSSTTRAAPRSPTSASRSAGASDMTETGSIMGTAQYLSPEQAQGLAVTPRSDLYASASSSTRCSPDGRRSTARRR